MHPALLIALLVLGLVAGWWFGNQVRGFRKRIVQNAEEFRKTVVRNAGKNLKKAAARRLSRDDD